MNKDGISRREMLRNAALASVGLGLLGDSAKAAPEALEALVNGPAPAGKTMIGVPFEKHEVVRIAIVGTGLRGRSTLEEWLNVPGVQITALADIAEEKDNESEGDGRKSGAENARVVLQKRARLGEPGQARRH